MNYLLNKSLEELTHYCESSGFKGYDPYDTLNSFVNFKVFGKWGSPLAIQMQKRNPINIRPILGIKKEFNPKGMGLFLKAYCILYKITGNKIFLDKADWLFKWLIDNYSKGYSGMCWGYNFDWASPQKYWKAYSPSVVVTSFVIDGIYEYFNVSKSKEAQKTILSAAEYILNDIPITHFDNGIVFSYSHLTKDCCYNASLLAAEILAKANVIKLNINSKYLINDAISFVISRQNPDGSWNYSYDLKTNKERRQIDFHQGFILVSLHNLYCLLESKRQEIESSIKTGLDFYREKQFFNNGQSLWRLPKKWPADIHNQSQGILTFSIMNHIRSDALDFAFKISKWTIENMQNRNGFFYYRKHRFILDKTPYMRWGQAWMLLALATLCSKLNEM